jgi:uncharacterized membrane protein YeaQ/YmgE (transglycosylase-associated protein family)
MHISTESLLVILLIGAVAGWLAGQIVQGTGFGLLGDIIIGIIGAFIASWLFPQLGLHLGAGIVAEIIAATIGAVLLLVIMRRSGDAGVGSRTKRRYKRFYEENEEFGGISDLSTFILDFFAAFFAVFLCDFRYFGLLSH